MMGRPSIGGRTLAKAIAQPKEVYSFPVLEPEEIADVLREMGAAVTEEDFSKPKPDTFRQWCELFVLEILGISKDELYAAHFEFAEALDGNNELHEASVPIMHFVRNMNKVLAAARCDEGLSLRDLMKPERARVLRVLSALINLQKFKVEKLVWYAGQEEKKTDVLRRKEAVDAQHEDLRRRIDAERSLRDAEQPAIAAAQAQRRELENRRDALSAQLEDLRTSTKATKDEIIASRDAAAQLQARIAEVRAEIEATRALIVSSPAKVKAEVASLEAAAEGEQRALEEADAGARIVGRQLEVVAKAHKDVAKAMQLMAEAEAEAVKLKRVQKDEKARKGEVEAAAGEVEQLRAQLEHVNAHKRRVEEKLAELRASAEARLAAQAKELEAVRREAAEYSDDVKAATDARRSAEAEEMRLERRKEALIAQHSAEVADMVASLKRLSGSLAGYHAGLFAGLASLDAVPLQQHSAGGLNGLASGQGGGYAGHAAAAMAGSGL